MIVSKTPLRVSLFCGGSDMPWYYSKFGGNALSMAIDKYVYVSINRTPYTGVRTMYDQTEDAVDAEGLKNVIVRETLKKYEMPREVTVASVTDVRAHGAGLGSSSTFTVGLVAAVKRALIPDLDYFNPFYLAESAVDIEINRCGYAIGKQDQYAAAFGGVNFFRFKEDGEVTIRSPGALIDGAMELQKNLMLVYSGSSRSADDILRRQAAEALSDPDKLSRIKRNAERALEATYSLEHGDVLVVGQLLNDAWRDKKLSVSGMTDDRFDAIYDRAMEAGAVGGKLLGAGGGGFFLFYVEPDKQASVARAVSPCLVYPFSISLQGCQCYEI